MSPNRRRGCPDTLRQPTIVLPRVSRWVTPGTSLPPKIWLLLLIEELTHTVTRYGVTSGLMTSRWVVAAKAKRLIQGHTRFWSCAWAPAGRVCAAAPVYARPTSPTPEAAMPVTDVLLEEWLRQKSTPSLESEGR